MKKIFIYFSLVFLCFSALASAAAAEQVLVFESDVKVKQDSSILVTEKIKYDFGNLQRHGIYRDIPYKYSARGGTYKIDIKVLSVTDEKGRGMPYTTSRSDGNLRLKIGRADEYVTGAKVYTINYQAKGALNFFDDHDELYWNATGNDWQVPILNAEARVKLPPGAAPQQVDKKCFTGRLGSHQENCSIGLTIDGLIFKTTNLSAGEGLTVVAGWPKGLVKEPSAASKIWKKVRDNLVLLLPVLVFIFLFWRWRKYGRDPLGRGVIMPEYQPPEGILPAEAGVVIDEKMDTRDITATIIDLARRGYLKIKEEAGKKVLGIPGKKDWQLINTHKDRAGLVNYEIDLLNVFFGGDIQDFVSLSGLKSNTSFVKQIKVFKENVYDRVAKKGWFTSNPDETRNTFMVIGTGIFIFIWIFAGVVFKNWLVGISLTISALLFLIFSRWMPKKTKQGALIKEKLEGFKMFLSATEKDRVKFHFSPQAHPEKFAEYLPWAIIFGVEKEWAKVFEGIDLPQPDWYDGVWAGYYSAWALSNSLDSFGGSLNKNLAAAGAAGGASGFSGGGFSGGGFGGGGGGSW